MRRPLISIVAVLFLFLMMTAAQESNRVGVAIGDHAEHGAYLTDAEGNSLYLFLNDQSDQMYQDPYASTCYDQCAVNWPPVIVDVWPPDDADGVVGEGVDEELLTTVEREDGSLQLVYGKWPLYYFIRDETPGDTNGQGIGDVWYLVSAEGDAVGRDEAQEEQGGDADTAEDEDAEADATTDGAADALMAEGEQVFHSVARPTCASCHGAEGQGAVGPRLVGSNVVENKDRFIRLILRGTERMPAFGPQLSDQQVAAVATYVRNAWGNDFGPVSAEEVSEWR